MRNAPSTETSEELRIFETKMKQLKRDYEQYFLGSRPREPSMLRGELQKTMIRLGNGQIRNTGERFRYNTLNSQFLTYKRYWDDTLRKIENGTYTRHVFKANLRDRARGVDDEGPKSPAKAAAKTAQNKAGQDDIFTSYMDAAKSCGQATKGLTKEKLASAMEKQATAIKQKMGVSDVKFRVEVVDGKVKLKASAKKAKEPA